jgi:hypothetical protein
MSSGSHADNAIHATALRFATIATSARDLNDPFWRSASVSTMYWRSTGGRREPKSRQDEAVLDAEVETMLPSLAFAMEPWVGAARAEEDADDGDPAEPAPGEDEPRGSDEAEGEGETGSQPLVALTDEERAAWLKALKGTRYTKDPSKSVEWPVIPGSPGSSSGGGNELCGVKRFEYPKCWKTDKDPPYVGIWFKAELEYKNEPQPPYYCDCCVFRQLIHKSSSINETDTGDIGTGYRTDWGTYRRKRVQYGGKRPDGSKRGDPDKPEEEGGIWSSECEFCMVDRPGVVLRGPGTYTVTWDFVGLVFDRCRNWLLVAAKRFVGKRKFRYESGKITNLRGGTSVTTGVPPDSPRDEPRGSRMDPDEACSICGG